MRRFTVITLAAALAGLLPTQDLAAQRGKKAKDAWKLDPYTEGKDEALEKAGYVSLGPFIWGDDHDTLQIEHVLGDQVKLLWVETAHFRIGSTLPPYKIPREKTERTKLKKELLRLKKKLPKIKTSAKELDRWTRLHLFAQRLEETYQQISELLGVTTDDFPKTRGERVNDRYMGEGPYLGQQEKYTVLLFEKKTTCGHYLRNFLKMDHASAMRHNFVRTGSLLYVTSTEFAEETLKIDTALHCEAAFNAVHSLLDGYRYYWHNMPHWFRQGLAHCYLRDISPKYNVYNEATRYDNQPEKLWNWPPRVHARAKFDHFPRAEEILQWADTDEKKLTDSMMLWSRVDYLRSLGDDGLRDYIHQMSEPFGGTTQPTAAQIHERQLSVMKDVWDLEPASYDAAWRKWVLRNYPKN